MLAQGGSIFIPQVIVIQRQKEELFPGYRGDVLHFNRGYVGRSRCQNYKAAVNPYLDHRNGGSTSGQIGRQHHRQQMSSSRNLFDIQYPKQFPTFTMGRPQKCYNLKLLLKYECIFHTSIVNISHSLFLSVFTIYFFIHLSVHSYGESTQYKCNRRFKEIKDTILCLGTSFCLRD